MAAALRLPESAGRMILRRLVMTLACAVGSLLLALVLSTMFAHPAAASPTISSRLFPSGVSTPARVESAASTEGRVTGTTGQVGTPAPPAIVALPAAPLFGALITAAGGRGPRFLAPPASAVPAGSASEPSPSRAPPALVTGQDRRAQDTGEVIAQLSWSLPSPSSTGQSSAGTIPRSGGDPSSSSYSHLSGGWSFPSLPPGALLMPVLLLLGVVRAYGRPSRVRFDLLGVPPG